MFGYISEALPGFGGSGVMTICDGRSLFNKQQVVYNFLWFSCGRKQLHLCWLLSI
jgi:hypothetical protein